MFSIAATAAAKSASAGTDQSSPQSTPQPRLVRAAHEFEAQMMKELMKPMTGSNGLDGEDGDSSSGSGSALGEFASEALGRALSEHGGFGIATSIVHELSQTRNQQVTAQVPSNLHGNTVIKSRE
jgi:Rod binding domain-containing protein